VTTLGRGGSDLSATVLGAALDLKEVQVWKDVDGVLTSDPRIVSGTRPVCELTFEEATELAYFGAQVLHPAAMQPAIRSGKLNVRVKNSYNRWARAGCAARGGVGWPVMVRGASPGDGVSWSGWAAAGCWVLGAGC
jgi:aspartate kinase